MVEFLSLRDAVARNLNDGDVVAFEGFTHLIPPRGGARGNPAGIP